MFKLCFIVTLFSIPIIHCFSGRSNPTSSLTATGQRPQTPARAGDAADAELLTLSERLFEASTPNIFNQISVNLQRRTYSSGLNDDAPARLLSVSNSTLSGIQTVVKLRTLFDNYELDTMTAENVTSAERQEEDEFLDKVLDTPVMKIAMTFLQQKGSVKSDRVSHKQLLRTIWFTIYSRGNGKLGSCGFEHVFMNEIKNNEISGLHNWIYFNDQENSNQSDLDYKGYIKSLQLGRKAQLIKYRVGYKNLNKPVNTMFIGTLPELEMALYTICLELKKTKCDISLGGKKLSIKAFPFFFRGKRVIGSAYPEF